MNAYENKLDKKIIDHTLQTELTSSLIGGEWLEEGEIRQNTNPSDSSDVVSTYYEATAEQTRKAIDVANTAQKEWAKSSIYQRQKILNFIGDKLLDQKDYYGEILSREAGKPIAEATDEIVKSAEFFHYFAAEAIRNKGAYMDSPRDNVDIEIINVPVGVVGVITPWNYPMAIPAWKIAPALAFANSVVYKPSDTTTASAYILAKIIDSSPLPKGVFNLVLGKGSIVGNELSSSSKVDAITFTGSVATGRLLAKNSIDHMIKLQLEMGSKNSLIVLDDADLELAVQAAVKGSYNATGQKCTATAKLIVTEKIHDRFLARMKEEIGKLKVGNSLDKNTQLGPAISKTQLEQNLGYIKLGIEEGATLVCGGEKLEREHEGNYFSPALFIDGKSSMRLNQEEIFGPISCIIKVKDYDEAIEVLNDTEYGLSGGIITNDLHYAMRFKHDADIGNVMINLPTAGMDNHVPFGGKKSSSFGSREKSYSASSFYTTTKTAYIKY